MTHWSYYNEQGDKITVTGNELKELAQTGIITRDTIVETEEGKSAPARKVKGLKFAEPTQSELTPEVTALEPQPLPSAPVPPVMVNLFASIKDILSGTCIRPVQQMTVKQRQKLLNVIVWLLIISGVMGILSVPFIFLGVPVFLIIIGFVLAILFVVVMYIVIEEFMALPALRREEKMMAIRKKAKEDARKQQENMEAMTTKPPLCTNSKNSVSRWKAMTAKQRCGTIGKTFLFIGLVLCVIGWNMNSTNRLLIGEYEVAESGARIAAENYTSMYSRTGIVQDASEADRANWEAMMAHKNLLDKSHSQGLIYVLLGLGIFLLLFGFVLTVVGWIIPER